MKKNTLSIFGITSAKLADNKQMSGSVQQENTNALLKWFHSNYPLKTLDILFGGFRRSVIDQPESEWFAPAICNISVTIFKTSIMPPEF